MFIGPPWNSLPLSHVIDYGSIALFFNVTGSPWWLKADELWKLELPLQPPAWQQQAPLS